MLAAVGAVAATSANESGGPDPPRLADVPEELRGVRRRARRGRPARHASTVIDFSGEEPRCSARARRRPRGDRPRARRRALGGHRPGVSCYRNGKSEMAIAQEPRAPPQRGAGRDRPGDRRAARAGARAPARPDRADRVRELHVAVGARGGRLDADEQVRRGLSRASATTAAARSSTRSRTIASDRAKALFGAEHANVQPHAGAQANMGVYFAVLQPGDTVIGPRSTTAATSRTASRSTSRGSSTVLPLRRLARDDARRLRRGARAREGAPAEADRLRRLRLSAHGRGRRASARSPTRWGRC